MNVNEHNVAYTETNTFVMAGTQTWTEITCFDKRGLTLSRITIHHEDKANQQILGENTVTYVGVPE